jgi:hypothetical protein
LRKPANLTIFLRLVHIALESNHLRSSDFGNNPIRHGKVIDSAPFVASHYTVELYSFWQRLI